MGVQPRLLPILKYATAAWTLSAIRLFSSSKVTSTYRDVDSCSNVEEDAMGAWFHQRRGEDAQSHSTHYRADREVEAGAIVGDMNINGLAIDDMSIGINGSVSPQDVGHGVDCGAGGVERMEKRGGCRLLVSRTATVAMSSLKGPDIFHPYHPLPRVPRQ